MEGRDIGVEPVAHKVLPPGLHLDYDPDSETRGVDDIAPVLTPSLLSSLVGNIRGLEKPEIPTQLVPFKAGDGVGACGWIPPKTEAPGLSHEAGMIPQTPASKGEVSKHKPPDQGTSQEEGLLTECPPDKFTSRPGWVPLYTKESLMKHLPAALSTFSGSGAPSLTAVVPPQFPGSMDKGVSVDELPSTWELGKTIVKH